MEGKDSMELRRRGRRQEEGGAEAEASREARDGPGAAEMEEAVGRRRVLSNVSFLEAPITPIAGGSRVSRILTRDSDAMEDISLPPPILITDADRLDFHRSSRLDPPPAAMTREPKSPRFVLRNGEVAHTQDLRMHRTRGHHRRSASPPALPHQPADSRPSTPPPDALDVDEFGFHPVEPPPDTDPDLNPHIDAVRRANRRARRQARKDNAAAKRPKSVVSGTTKTSARTRLTSKSAKKTFRKVFKKVAGLGGSSRRRRRSRSRASSGSSSSSGSTSLSSTSRGRTTTRRGSVGSGTASRAERRSRTTRSSSISSGTSTSSSSSASTWWRFWRDSSSTSSGDSQGSKAPGWMPPLAPEFTLMTPSNVSQYAQHVLDAQPAPSSHGVGGPLAFGLAGLDNRAAPALPVYDLFTSPDMDSALQRLLTHWKERSQEDGVTGDLGVTEPHPVLPPSHPHHHHHHHHRHHHHHHPRASTDSGKDGNGTADAAFVAPATDVDNFNPLSRLPTHQEHQEPPPPFEESDLAAPQDDDRAPSRRPSARRARTESIQAARDKIPKIRHRRPLAPMHRVTFSGQGTILDRPRPMHSKSLGGVSEHPSTDPSPAGSRPGSNDGSPPGYDGEPDGDAAAAKETGTAWWLDVLNPTPADMHRLRKIFPLHPLTIEDILHQDQREKLETFDALGYYLVSFRAMDEGYFRYTDDGVEDPWVTRNRNNPGPPPPPAGMADPETSSAFAEQEKLRQKLADARDDGSKASAASVKSARTVRSGKQKGAPGYGGSKSTGTGRRPRVEIVEALGDKGGVEGVGAGAVNMYLVVFGDGLISFHFEDLQSHIDRVRDRIQYFGSHLQITPHWIAYGLMDSIVDAFFPVLGFIESESDALDSFLADPFPSMDSADPIERSRLTRTVSALPASLRSAGARLVHRLRPKADARPRDASSTTRIDIPPRADAPMNAMDPLFDRGALLRRITNNRKLVVAMTRLLAQKSQVVRGLRKRMRETHEGANKQRDISVYLGDLQDHIVSMMQQLAFYDHLLSHDHPGYLGVLRLAMNKTKSSIDTWIIRLYLITLTVYSMQTVHGVFSLNVNVPHNGDRKTHLRADGSRSPFNVFGIIIVAQFIPAGLLWGLLWYIFRKSEKKTGRTIKIF